MDLNLFIKEGDKLRSLKVPTYVVKNLLRDRLSKSELERIDRLAEDTQPPKNFIPGSIIVDFATKTAESYQAGINFEDLDPTWTVKQQKLTLQSYLAN